MDRPEGTHAAGDASRRLSTPGAAPEPGQGCLSRQAGRRGAGSRVLSIPVGTPDHPGDHRGQRKPRQSGFQGSRPGRAQVSTVLRRGSRAARGVPSAAGEPSVTPVPQGGRREPELPTRFNWDTVYSGIRVRHATDTDRGDTYAAAASGSGPS